MASEKIVKFVEEIKPSLFLSFLSLLKQSKRSLAYPLRSRYDGRCRRRTLRLRLLLTRRPSSMLSWSTLVPARRVSSKLVKEITGLGLKEAKEVVDNAPKPVKEGISKADADEIRCRN
jgi:large subunit ribosomal protein L7/L12